MGADDHLGSTTGVAALLILRARLRVSSPRRGTAFQGFDSQLQFSHYLQPLVHVDAAWTEADGSGIGLDDGIPSFLYNDIRVIRSKLRALLGDDLTKFVPGNQCWHTGNAVPLDGGDFRERMPWEYVDRVMEGSSAGSGRTRRQSWRSFVRDWLENHWLSSDSAAFEPEDHD